MPEKTSIPLKERGERLPFPDSDALFLQDWWWEAVCPEREVFRIEEAGKCTGFWPLAKIRRMLLFPVYACPGLTQHAGPWMERQSDFCKLLARIPPRAMLCANLGFQLGEKEKAFCREAGFRVEDRPTFRITETEDLDAVFRNVAPAQQRQIRKARKHLHRQPCPRVEDLLRLQEETFERRGVPMPFSREAVRRLWHAVQAHRAGELVSLADEDGHVRACGLFVYDTHACYSLAHGFDKSLKNVGAGSLLQWEGIRIASEKGLVFDFEGSNIESIARFNSSFGASPFLYTRIERYTAAFRFFQDLRSKIGGIL